MLYSRFGCFFTILLTLFSQDLFANSVEDEFERCAAFVLREDTSESTVYQVDLSDVDLSHQESRAQTQKLGMREDISERPLFIGLEMELADGLTGKKIGDVRCYLTQSGQLIGAEFVKFYPDVASN